MASSFNPLSLAASALTHRHLIYSMVRREVIGRYRGSCLGLLWSFFNPLLMLLVYTFCFSFIFKIRWAGADTETHANYSIVLFVGLIIHGIFAESITRAPLLIVSHANYVKKIVFPLDVLPWVVVGTSVFHALISTLILISAYFIIDGNIYWTSFLLPIVLFPFLLLVMGLSWILSAVGVYVRDISQFTSLIVTVLLFLSPVFYSLSALPERFRAIAYLNPLTIIIEDARLLLLYGKLPNWNELFIYSLISFCIAWYGFVFFQKMRKGFSDVL